MQLYEVELKFHLDEPAPILQKLKELGAITGKPIVQKDRYFGHPVRKFEQTDEAVRIRAVDDENRITYKGPVLAAETKTRREIEIHFASGLPAQEQMAEMLTILGFCEVRIVQKQRTPITLTWDNFKFDFTRDQVTGLGTFLEMETLADEATLSAAQECILQLATKLGLESANQERRSYLQMLLELDENS